MNWQKKLAKLFSAIFLVLLITSCEGNYCVDADEFDNDYVKVKANPVEDGVFGATYDHVDGGQVATWHETGLRANGKPFLIQISGGWVPWYGNAMTDGKLDRLKRCNFCAKKNSDPNENCICYNNQTPRAEIAESGVASIPDSSCETDSALQANPNKCTCTKLNGKATDDGVFHFPLNFYKKDHSVKLPDDQGSACKYDGGMGLYLGLFGVSGGEMPIRVYHLFSEKTTCPINRNSNGECKDESGADQTRYIFRSANDRIFVKNDNNNNNGTDIDSGNDSYHRPNELVKLIIHDRYYSDNYGQYNVTFLEGVNRDGDMGLLEFLVGILEDATLGTTDANGNKTGGILEYMYKAIVQDTYFAATLQISLSLYIAFFGLATLIGLVDITKKELLSRLVKLSLVIFFTTPTSWYWYNKMIVTFFKDGMDVIITMFSDFVNSSLSQDDAIRVHASLSNNPNGGASRFSYVDTMIKTLFSDNVTKKIWGLFFESFFGFVYIAAIYFLIGFFIYVMLLAAMIYMVTLMKLIFVLALGPIFIVFSLFGQTNSMFKNWLGFVGARSLEMVILFLILYTFVMILDGKFVEMLRYRVCTHSVNFGLFSFKILLAQGGRGFLDWCRMLLGLAGFIYILMEICKKIPEVAGQLISVSGNDGGGALSSSTGMASTMLNGMLGLAASGAKFGLIEGGGQAFRAIRTGSRALGVSGAIDKITDKIPVRGIRTRLRDSVIDSAIALGQKDAAAKGLQKGTVAYDNAVRNFALNDQKSGILAFQHNNKKKAALYDFSRETIDKRLDQKLVKDPLKDFIKNKAKEIKKGDPKDIPLGKDMDRRLREEAQKWAEKSLVGGAESVDKHLHDLKNFLHKRGKLSDDEAAKKFAGQEDLKDRFLQYKQERAFEKGKNLFTHQAGKNFIRKVGYEEKRSNDWRDSIGLNTGKGLNPLNRVGWVDKLMKGKTLDEQTRAAMEKASLSYLQKGGYDDEKTILNRTFQEKVKGNENTFYGKQLAKKHEKDLQLLEAKRAYFKMSLQDKIGKEVARDTAGKTPEEIDQMRQEAAKEAAEMRRKQMEAIKDNDWSYIKENGGINAIRDGLTDFNGNNMLAAEMRAKALGASDGDMATAAKSNGTVLEFGADLNSAIGLQSSDFGLKAGNPLLGAEEKERDDGIKQSLLNMRNAMKSAAQSTAKIKQDALKFQEYKVAQLELELSGITDPANKKLKEQEISAEIKKRETMRSEATDAERSLQTIESSIQDLKNS